MPNSKTGNQKKNYRLKNYSLSTYLTAALFYLSVISGCATSGRPTAIPSVSGLPGIYHRVERGETLWRISKIYNSGLDEITKLNRIFDATKIEVGQQIFIPNRQRQPAAATNYSSDDFIWPLKGKVISTFSQAHNNIVNKGINIRPYDNPQVVASRSGRVVFNSDDFGVFGKTVIIDHGDGFSTVYARNSLIFVKAGETVQKGASIARAGSTVRDKNIYLHFQIRKGYLAQNPYYYLP